MTKDEQGGETEKKARKYDQPCHDRLARKIKPDAAPESRIYYNGAQSIYSTVQAQPGIDAIECTPMIVVVGTTRRSLVVHQCIHIIQRTA